MKYTFDLDYKKMWESATDKALILQEENKVLKESSEHNDKVVDKVNWENMLLKKENKQLKECYCNRTDCSGRIKNSRNYDSLYQKYNKQLDNWNKLKEEIPKVYDFYSKLIAPEYGALRALIRIKNFMQELEKESENCE